MITKESLLHTLREIGGHTAFSSGILTPSCLIAATMHDMSLRVKPILQDVGNYLIQKKEIDEYSMCNSDGFIEITGVKDSKREFAITVTHVYNQGKIDTRIRWIDVPESYFVEIFVQTLFDSSNSDLLFRSQALYDLACVCRHGCKLPVNLVHNVDGYGVQTYWATEAQLSHIANRYKKWITYSEVSGRNLCKFSVPELLETFSSAYVTYFKNYSMFCEKHKPFSTNWNLSVIADGQSHVLCFDTALAYHGVIPEQTPIPTLWTEDKNLDKVNMCHVRFMYLPEVNKDMYVYRHPKHSHILIPCVERCILDMINCEDLFDTAIFNQAICWYKRHYGNFDKLYTVAEDMRTGCEYFTVTRERIDSCIYE